jgi:diadenosine tetraphosphatase ApaH/serine/threonine PP2A family protein phosphatase
MIALSYSPRRNSAQHPRVPAGVRVYAVGDVHGRADLLQQVFKRIDEDHAHAPVPHRIEVFLGDYVDRGPASRQVLELLIDRGKKHPSIFLKGNHETLLMNFHANPLSLVSWQKLGGLETLVSYGLTPPLNADARMQVDLAVALDKALPFSHKQFLADLQLSYTCGDYFFVHAGIRPGVALDQQREQDLLWIRQEFLLCEDEFDKIVVHGHTPVLEPEIRSNRINIDTGAYATGRLSCLVLEADAMRIL